MSRVWKIAFCGLGSIGSRHLRNIGKVLKNKNEEFVVDLIRHEKGEIPAEFTDEVNHVYGYDEDIPKDYDIIFITNPTSEHYKVINRYQWHTKSMFIEKPLFDIDDYKLDVINKDCIFYVACPVRYKKIIQYLKKNVDTSNVLSAIAICSSYLPEWRPNTDYRKCYSAIKKLGGGVSLDLIHEIDYLSYLLGEPQKIHNIRGHISELEIDSDDVSVYIAKMPKAVVQIYLDYIGRKDIRKLLLMTDEDTIEADLLKNEITYLKEGKKVCFQETRDDFQIAELLYFFNIIDGKVKNTNDLTHAYEMLKHTFGR